MCTYVLSLWCLLQVGLESSKKSLQISCAKYSHMGFSFSDIMHEPEKCFVFRKIQIHISLYLAYNFYVGRCLILHQRIFINLLKQLQFKIRYFLCVNTRFSEDRKLNYIIYSFVVWWQWTQKLKCPVRIYFTPITHLGYQFPIYYFLLFIALYTNCY